ncbi:DUF2303 family protein [Spartinivicinus poritis]|uniref:DUF2303 family protein n=1 Tax=Spartinivicinus poritis TaxID=2994640 RepID=A0ABT5UEL7_9GAMM|nr:DUF2303 family protein [Spartinivicinus sp. A2-2]MDE1464824.1 DUF2303 family protein [Spartinivicinus sp. A2-2]
MEHNSVQELIKLGASQVIHNKEGIPFVAISHDYKLTSIEQYLPHPIKMRQHVKMNTVQSLINYINRFKNPHTTIFADDTRQSFNAVIDFHVSQDEPRSGSHTVEYGCPLSREWEAWQCRNNEKMDQTTFAEFLEERAEDIVNPSGAELLEIALKFNVIRKAVFGSAMRLSTGEYQFTYSEDNQKGTVELPEQIKLGLAPFHNGEKYEVKAKLYYRLQEGQLLLWYKLVEPERVIEDAFNEVTQRIQAGVGDLMIIEGRDA